LAKALARSGSRKDDDQRERGHRLGEVVGALMVVVLQGDAPLVAEEVEVAIGGADRHLELTSQVGGLKRLAGL